MLINKLENQKYLLNNIVANNTIGITQFKSIKNPKIKLPIRAPPLPKVSDKAAAITLWNTIKYHSKSDENNKLSEFKSTLN